MPYRPLETARRDLGISVLDLWWSYFALGGDGDAYALENYLSGRSARPTAMTHNAIVHALNETFSERGQNSPLPYLAE